MVILSSFFQKAGPAFRQKKIELYLLIITRQIFLSRCALFLYLMFVTLDGLIIQMETLRAYGVLLLIIGFKENI